MPKSSLLVALIILSVGAGTFVCHAGSGVPVARNPDLAQREDTVAGPKNVQVGLTCDPTTGSLEAGLTDHVWEIAELL